MSQQNMRESAHALFEYLKAVSQLSQRKVFDVEKQIGCVFLNRLNDPSCVMRLDTGDDEAEEAERVLISFHKPDFSACPPPDRALVPWLVPGWHDYQKTPEHLDVLPPNPGTVPTNAAEAEVAYPDTIAEQPGETQEHFSDSPERVALFDDWAARREGWAEEQRHIKALRDTFADLFDMYNLYRQSPDTLELMIGNGVLTDQKRGDIRHPLYLKRIQIRLEAADNTLVVSDTDEPGEMYLPMFSELADVSSDQVRLLENEAQDQDIHPLDHNACGNLLKSVTHMLSAESRYMDEDEQEAKSEERITVRWNPVLFLRKRPDGTVKALEGIIQDIENGADIPGSLTGILGGGFEPTDSSETDGSEDTEESGSSELFIEDEDILLPKPANREQIQIVRQIERAPAVLVQGPPGTGKTHTIANLLGHFLAQGKSVLVTSHTSKALTVLKDKVPEDIQPLCVSMLDNNRADMEKSINAIIEYTTLNNAHAQKRKADMQCAERHQTLLELQEARKLVYAIRHSEFEPIVYNGEGWTPSRAAEYIAEKENLMGLIPGPITAGAPFPLTDEELSLLYAGNDLLSRQDEVELACALPEAEDLLPPDQLAEEFKLQECLNAKLRNLSAEDGVSLVWEPARHAVINTLTDQVYVQHGDYRAEAGVQAMLAVYEEAIPVWAPAAIADGADTGLARKKWEQLLVLITETYEKSQIVLENQLQKPVRIKVGDYEHLIPVFRKIQIDADKHGCVKTGLLVKKEKKEALEAVSIGGSIAETSDDIARILDYMELLSLREHLSSLWDSLPGAHGERRFSQLGDEPERFCYQQQSNIVFWLNWAKETKDELLKQAETAGIGYPLLHPFENLLSMTDEKASALIDHIRTQLIPAAGLLHLINRLYAFTRTKENTLELLTNCHESEICRHLKAAIDSGTVENYQIAISDLTEVRSKSSIARQRAELLDKVSKCAPQWAEAVRTRTGNHGSFTVPEGLKTAWKVRQLSIIVDRITSTSLSEAEKTVSNLTERYRKETAKLAGDLAWFALQQRIDANPGIRQSLNGWKQTIAKIGKGTGKRAPALRVKARKLMLECQKAVPAWIMPVSGVMNTVDLSTAKYDVIIIDEASQSDITAAAILYLGKKIIVVGDDEQVSPLSVGLDDTKMGSLRDMLIKDKIPNSHLWDGTESLYDIAAQVYQPLMLREHFRCVSDIIGYSNWLSYHNKIKPLREAGSSPFKTATVSYRVNGIRRGRGKINEEEAHAVVALIQACLEQPEYADKSFGVISMLGDDQAKLINRELTNAIPLQEYEQHQILCGNASNFQGDERDVIFLSLVDSNDADGPLAMATGDGNGSNGKPMKQRYNVAVSRARDQLWVIHSLDSGADLKPGDMRRGLLEYVANPKAYDQIKKDVEVNSDSPFEAEVATALITRGYHIEQQRRVGAYYIDMVAICGNRQIAVECDGERWHSGEEKIREDMERQSILERLGWKFIRIRGSEYYRGKAQTIERIIRELTQYGIVPEEGNETSALHNEEDELLNRVKDRAAQLLHDSDGSVSLPPHEPDKPSEIPSAMPEKPATKAPPLSSVPSVDTKPIFNELQHPSSVRKTWSRSKSAAIADETQLVFSLPDDELLAALQQAGFTYIDNREESGILWVIYESAKKDLFDTLSKRYSFQYAFERRGAVATKGKPAWRVRTHK